MQYSKCIHEAAATGSAAAQVTLDASSLDTVSSVVHLVGRVNDSVFSVLGPTTQALAEQGIHQTVILVDDEAHRHLLPSFHPSVRLSLISAEMSVFKQLRAKVDALCQLVEARPRTALHLHGLVPCLLALYASLWRGRPAISYFSPHHGPRRGRINGGALLLRALRPFYGRAKQFAIANVSADVPTLEVLTGGPVNLVESPVDPAFFAVERHESRRPLIVTGTRLNDTRGAALFAQLAVLLSEETLGVSFNWIGAADTESVARLKAADVAIYDTAPSEERASRLASGWLYLALSEAPGFPASLAEAMAAGLPCVAWDTPYHRDVLRHGETGFICNTEAEMLVCIAQLIDSRELRLRMGEAAKAEALRRFDGGKFREALLAAYQAPLTQVN